MGTVCPSVTLISFNTPAAGAGSSASTLSVEISNSGSSRSMWSPGFFSHLVMVPSKMLSPIWGMMTSTAIALPLPTTSVQTRRAVIPPLVSGQLPRGGNHLGHIRQKMFFERRRVRHRRVERGDPPDGSVKVLERALGHQRRDLPGDAAGARVLVHDQQLIRFLYRREDRLAVERQQRA